MNFDYDMLDVLVNADNSEIHFDLLTVSSIIGGFMFTSLGLLLSVSEYSIIKKLNETSIMSKKNGRIIKGLTFNMVSIFISLIFILKLEKVLIVFDKILKSINFNISIYGFLINYLAILGLICLVMSFIYFSLSIKDITTILRAIEEDNKKKKLPPELIDNLKDKINKK